MGAVSEAQSLSVKRAQVEFHNFASLGQPELNLRIYAEENERRRGVILRHRDFVGEITPFLEIGANAGHTSYMLANEFGASGFALDISADSLRHGRALMKEWGLERAPVRVAGDALHLPLADGTLRFVCAFQVLSQFMDVGAVLAEVARVLQPGGVFLFAEEPLWRKLSLRLYRCPYEPSMKPWERKLYDWGLLGYMVRDVIGAEQEESFGIRQNHTMGLREWHDLIHKYFAEHEFDAIVPERGWGERIVKKAAIMIDPHGSEWHAAKWLGGTLVGVCRKSGSRQSEGGFDRFENLLQCPDCGGGIVRDQEDTLRCVRCPYRSPNADDVYNLLPSAERRELYPGVRDDIIDFSQPGHERQLLDGWSDLEGIHGNKYRWMGASASALLRHVKLGPQKLRIRGFAAPQSVPGEVRVAINELRVGERKLERPGVFVLEAPVKEASEYRVTIEASPVWTVPEDDRSFTVNISMIRLVEADK